MKKKEQTQAEFMFSNKLTPGCWVGRRGGRFVRTTNSQRAVGVYQEEKHFVIYTVDGRKEFDLPAGVQVFGPVTTRVK